MSSRDDMLRAIAANKPAFVDLPTAGIQKADLPLADAVQLFIKTLAGIGGKAVVVAGIAAVQDDLRQSINDHDYIVNTIPALGEVNAEINGSMQADALEPVYKTFIEATLGVAENGCVWLYEHQLKNRLLPFICQHLVICLNASNIVPTMHEAYEQLDVAKEGYGLFLAGPSKTADIEQSLVIGAHGARSLLVYLVGNN